MKTRLILTLFTVLLIFSACNKDDDHTDPIVGTWEIRETHENYTMYMRFTFNSNQTGEYYYTEAEKGEEIDEKKDDLVQFTYSLIEDELSMTYSITEYEPEYIHHEVTDEYRYSISDNKLSLSYKDELRYCEPEFYTRKN